MQDFQRGDSVDRESQAWNVAQGYTHLKILKPLVEMDKLVRIAIYGSAEIENSNQFPESIKTNMRIEAMNRLIDVSYELVENATFAMNSADTREKLNELNTRIEIVDAVVNGISRRVIDQRTQEQRIVINEDHFWACINELRSIKKEFPIPLNKNNLIFPSSEEIDLDKIKRDLIEGG